MQLGVDSLSSIVGLFSHGPVKILAITAAADRTIDTIDRFLDGNGMLAEFYEHGERRSWVAVVRERDAEFYAMRLASGLIGCKVCDDLNAARDVISEVMFA